jgi:hypothetical protein
MKRAWLGLGSALCAGIIFNASAWTLVPDIFHDLVHSDQPLYLTILFMVALLVITVLPW